MLAPLLILAMSIAAPVAPSARVAVRALAYNVDFEAGAAERARSLSLIEGAAPDLVCLTEVTPAFAAEFRKRLGGRYPHLHFVPASGTWGLGLASRFPLSNARTFQQRPHRMPGMEATVSIQGRSVRLGCLHLFPPGAKRTSGDGLLTSARKNAALRAQQAQGLVERFGRAPAALLLGDFNEGPSGDAVRRLQAAGYQRSCDGADAQCGATFPGDASRLPAVFEIDHLLGRGLDFSGARVLKGGGSDHFAVMALTTLR